MLNVICVGGTFDADGGRASKVAAALFDGVRTIFSNAVCFNGGTLERLVLLAKEAAKSDLVFWLPNVDNAERKLIRHIKRRSTCILVSSKRNLEGQYTLAEVIQRALVTKSNLILEIKKSSAGQFSARVLDPLGNAFSGFSENFEELGCTAARRAALLLNVHRTPSVCVGSELPAESFDSRFLQAVRHCARQFQELIPAVRTERFLGNASFRCRYGFPSVRKEETIFVSKRNIDKASIDEDGFVPVALYGEPVRYYGPDKPSVDTPVQLMLYRQYPNIKYMLHGHVYVQGAPYTKQPLPCGARQEFAQIKQLVDNKATSFVVNLVGHGMLAGSDEPALFDALTYVARPLPEYQEDLLSVDEACHAVKRLTPSYV